MKFEFFKRKEPQPFYAQKDELKSNPLFFSAFDSSSRLSHPFTYSYTQNHPLNINSRSHRKRNLMQRLSNWFEDHLPLRGRRSDTRRADSVARGNCPSTQSKASCPQKISQSVVKKASRSAAPPRLRYSSASSDVAGKIYPYGSEKKRRSGQKMVVSHEEPAINYFKDYDHQEYDSGDDEDDDDEEDEFLLITTSGYAAAAARPQMASSMYAKSGHKDAIPPINGLSQSFTAACNNGSGSCRKSIRTNPWIVRKSDERLSSRSSCSAFHQPARVAGIAGRNTTNLQASMSLRRPTPVRRVPSSQGNRTEQHLALPIKSTSGMTGKRAEGWNLYASINRSGNLNGLKALDESTCSASSGYGSQDSSPESSVHSPDWQPPSSLSSSTVGDSSTSNILERDRTMDCHSTPTEENSNNRNDRNGNVFEARNQHMDKQKSGKYEDVNDEHIYHELECLNRLSLLLDDEQNNFNSELVSVAGSSYRLSYESTDQTHPHQDSQRNSSSPIYAVPYEAYRHVPAEIDLTISNNNYTGHYRHVKPIYRDLHLPSSKSTAQYNHGSNDLPVQQALQISSPFYSSHSPCPEGYRHDPIFASNHHSSAKNGLRTGIIVRAQPSLSDSSSEDEPEEEMMEEGEQSSTSCSSWTAMLISPRAQAQHRPCHFNAPPPPPLQQSMRARPNEFDFLAELDQQIVELQHQSDAVRHLVEQAKERHELRSKTRQLCMEHLKELRKMRWFMHNNFELCL